MIINLSEIYRFSTTTRKDSNIIFWNSKFVWKNVSEVGTILDHLKRRWEGNYSDQTLNL